MRTVGYALLAGLLMGLCASCDTLPPPASSDLLTDLSFTNVSKSAYASLEIRAHGSAGPDGPFVQTPLLPPGGVFRQSFFELIGVACPSSLDVRLLVYRRVNDDLPIGLDAGEAVESTPMAAGEVLEVPACGTAVLGIYTIVHWDSPEGTARVKIGQETDIESAIRGAGRAEFDADGVWHIDGVDPALADVAAPALPAFEAIRGQVTLANGTGVEGIGVVLRSRFRIRADDEDASNDPDAGFGEPFVFTVTDADGRFAIDRPPGSYEATFFSDDYLFRPASLILETPIDVIHVVVEPP